MIRQITIEAKIQVYAQTKNNNIEFFYGKNTAIQTPCPNPQNIPLQKPLNF